MRSVAQRRRRAAGPPGCATIQRVATTILIVDDHASFRTSARTLLETEGYEVVGEAEDGAAALRLAEELRPEVVLLDVHLPDLHGFEVTERLRESESPPAVILTSSRSDYSSAAASTSARGFVAKDKLSGPALDRLLA